MDDSIGCVAAKLVSIFDWAIRFSDSGIGNLFWFDICQWGLVHVQAATLGIYHPRGTGTTRCVSVYICLNRPYVMRETIRIGIFNVDTAAFSGLDRSRHAA